MSWQKILSDGFSSAAELLGFLNLPSALSNQTAEQQFKTRVPRNFAARMQAGNAKDPLLLQVLAVDAELQESSDYILDPLAEVSASKTPGLLHKYQGRVLLTFAASCAVNCRYCFRRHFPYQENNPHENSWSAALEYIQQDDSIKEVILSGGDPLLVADQKLQKFLQNLEAIAHVQTLRFHTRIPIVLPERIDESFTKILQETRLQKVVVMHCNHAQEIDQSVINACLALKNADCTLLNQSVLLKGINDRAEILAELSYQLFKAGILPYYLHVIDKVKGVTHFDLPLDEAKKIYQELQALVPGYLLPKLAREDAGQASKTLLVGVSREPLN